MPPLFGCTVPWYLIFYYNEQSWNDSQLNSGRTANIRALHKIVRMKTVSDSLSNPICTFVVRGSGCEHWVIYYHDSNTITKQKEADPTPPSLQIIIICFILHDVTHCRDFVTHQLLLSSMRSMLPERNHYRCLTKRCNSLWMSWIFTGLLQNEYIPCNYNLRFPPAFTTQAVLTKVHNKHETGLTTRPWSKNH